MKLGETTRRDVAQASSPAGSGGVSPPVPPAQETRTGTVREPAAGDACTTLRPSAFTLIELMVVVTIIGIMTALIIPEMQGTYQEALLRSTSRDLINVFDLTYSRAVSLNQVRRFRLDEKTGRYLVEKQVYQDGQENFVPVKDTGSYGEINQKISVTFHGPDDTTTADEDQAAAPKTDDQTPAEGATIAFYPDGTADPGVLELTDRDGFRLALKINPITARIQVKELERK